MKMMIMVMMFSHCFISQNKLARVHKKLAKNKQTKNVHKIIVHCSTAIVPRALSRFSKAVRIGRSAH